MLTALLLGVAATPCLRGAAPPPIGGDPRVRAWVLVGATALCAAVGVQAAGTGVHLAAFLWFAAAGVVLSVIDVHSLRLPNRIVGTGWVVTACAFAGEAARVGSAQRLLTSLAAGVVCTVALLVPAMLAPTGLGMGDTKLAGLIGVLLGWWGWGTVAAGISAGFVSAAVLGALLVGTGRIDPRDPLPFGPFLVGGAWFAIGAA